MAEVPSRPSGLTVTTELRARFIGHLGVSANVTAAADMVGVSRQTMYDWRGRDADFAAAWDEAIEKATDALEAEARRRAMEGVPEFVTCKDGLIYGKDGLPVTQRRYSDTLMALLLRAHRPEKFRERTETKIVGPDGGAVQVEAVRSRVDDKLNKLGPVIDAEPSGE